MTERRGPTKGKREAGFALPFTILLATLITIMLAAAFTRAASEHLVAESSEASLSALTVAQGGLQGFFGDTFSVRPAEGDSFRYNIVGGYAWVHPDVMVRPPDTLLDFTYVVRSVGYLIEPTQGSTPQATRTIAQFARWQTGSAQVTGLFTIPNGVIRRPGDTGSPNTVSGWDQCSARPQLPAFRAPIPDSIGGLDVDTISGNIVFPNWQSSFPQTVALETQVDWNQILSGDFTPDYGSIQLGNMSHPSQMVTGNAIISDGIGTGLLVVTGDLTTSGAWMQWNGVVLVGGRALFNAGTSYIRGVLVTGLNEQFGISPPPSEFGGTTSRLSIRYASCEVDDALKALTGFVPIENAWVDNWATY